MSGAFTTMAGNFKLSEMSFQTIAMNFKYMPELGWHWGYPMVLFIMAGVGIAMVYYFKKKR